MSDVTFFSAADLADFSRRVLGAVGATEWGAQVVTECLLYSDLRAIDSHGMTRLPLYVTRVQQGVTKADPCVTVHRSSPGALRVDGDNGLGPVVCRAALDAAIPVALKQGSCIAGIAHSSHFGAAGYYVNEAVTQGLIALVCSNTPPVMAPYGGRSCFLGTNPLAIGIPGGEEPPLILDMATSVVARGKIMLAAREGEPIPEGWAIDRCGNPTTNASDALEGAVLPFGGVKGSAIALVIDVLCGVLTGSGFAHGVGHQEELDRQQDVGHFILLFRTDIFIDGALFRRRMDEFLRSLRAVAPIQGDAPVMPPGGPERAAYEERSRNGIPLAGDVVARLSDLGRRLGIELTTGGMARQA